MIVKNVTYKLMMRALDVLNTEYDNNIKFKSLESLNAKNTRYCFRLTVINSSKAGGRLSADLSRRVAAACWHVHGRFFDILLSLEKNAVVSSSFNRKAIKIYREGDTIYNNWIDPCNYSQACNCGVSNNLKDGKFNYLTD